MNSSIAIKIDQIHDASWLLIVERMLCTFIIWAVRGAVETSVFLLRYQLVLHVLYFTALLRVTAIMVEGFSPLTYLFLVAVNEML